MGSPMAYGNQQIQGLVLQFLGLIAQQLLCSGVQSQDLAAGTDYQAGIGHAGHHVL
jgi:hypothetical protein